MLRPNVNYKTLGEGTYTVFEQLKLKGLSNYITEDSEWIISRDSNFIRKKYIKYSCSTRSPGTRFLRTCPNVYNLGGNSSRLYVYVGDISIIL